jgi:hypothetical protein
VAQDLGYRVALPQSQYVALSRVEDILPPENRRLVEARNDMLPVPLANRPPRQQPDDVEREEGLLAGPRRLTNRAFDALDEVGDWMLGRRY